MDEERRRKRNKKKKNNKQNSKTGEDAAGVAAVDGETASVDQTSRLSNGRAHGNEVSDAGPDAGMDRIEPLTNGVGDHVDIQSTLAGAVEQNWFEIKASLEENIQHLQNENDLHKEKEAGLATNIAQLEREKESWLQKEASFKEKISQIVDEKANLELKQESLEEKVRQLERGHNSWVSEEERLVEKIRELERDHDSWVLKEESLEEKIRQLGKDHESWLLKESSSKEILAKMETDISGLQLQVSKLEESKNSYLQENQRLKDNILELQGQIHLLEAASSVDPSDEQRKRSSEYDELNSRMEAACALVEKLITENADLVEKVNELYLQLDNEKAAPGLSSHFQSGSSIEIAESTSITDHSYASNVNMLLLNERPESSKDTQMHDDINSEEKLSREHGLLVSSSVKPEDSGEIVQIPLDDNEGRDLESQAVESEEEHAVALSDAPLIGAPFRLISFFASYVSGADLVDKDVKSSH
ncbi:sporulation-specific protein 15 isoform X3 [Rhodamnia argentea]|uniref:Sporulation-specific protein 15 isoform X3 n=1 Tax=Rhodamnia argentea TaxID=178133 RepID=A0ABM3HZ98_9MYRT|nr:sporulation-specific protein 15 isoform X3 [Rhodamnia argentea]